MSKQVPCFICKVLVEVKDERAIAKLCSVHDTPENRELLANTPIHQLLRVLNDGVQMQVDETKQQIEATDSHVTTELNKLRNQLKEIATKLDNISVPTEEPTKETTDGGLVVNEFGEVI